MKLTFKYPVYPTKTQEHTLFEWLDHLCELQNSARHDRIVVRETENRFVTQYDQQALLTEPTRRLLRSADVVKTEMPKKGIHAIKSASVL